MTKALGKEGSFAEGPSNSPRQRFFWKNPENFFAEGQGAGPRQRFLKKNSKKTISLPRAGPQQTIFFKKKPLPRALVIALGKDFFGKNPENFFAEGQGGGHRQRF